LANIFPALDYIDEPFADSSALAVYVLSNKTRQKVTVALSGDGGDELFGGYNKHQAELRARQTTIINSLLSISQPVLQLLPKSRHSKLTNLFRQLTRYSAGLNEAADKRYWNWCTLNSQQNAIALLKHKTSINESELQKRVSSITDLIKENGDLNDIFFADTQMVLPNDMLVKVDLMSMANSLEVRVPLLDYTIVDFAFSLPASYKITPNSGKKILKESFADELPNELFNREKKGFEVPLLKWLKTELRSLIEIDLLSREFVVHQNIFNYSEVEKMKRKLFSSDPGDTPAQIWALLVFQYWYKKYFLPDA
jgi:asparagine synthase (glutamine-hydrolysing)